VEKVTDPDPDPSDTSFAFTADYDAAGFSLKNGENNDSGNLDAGTYAVSETVPTGWDLASATCDDGSDPSAIDLAAGETVTCTFTNQADSNIIVKKETNPDGSLQTFEFDTDYGANFSLADGGSNDSGDIDPGTYSVSEINIPADWSLDTATCDDGSDPSTIDLAAGETVTCTFTNVQDGTVEVVKTVSGGLPNGATFDFELRTGASDTEVGTTVASTTTDGTTGEADFGGQTFAAGTYQFCEVNLLPGWHSTLSDDPGAFVPNSDDPNVDNSVVCVEFTLGAGQTVTFTIDNTPPPGGDARTIGFWKNWTSCDGHGNQDPVLDDTLALFPIASGQTTHGLFVGDVYVDTCAEAVALLNKSEIGGNKKANDAAYGLAAQLLAAQLNYAAGAIQCPAATNAINAGQALLDSIGFIGTGSYLGPKVTGTAAIQRANALALASTLDQYNNNLLC
jgi:plastocyanin